MYEKYYKNKKKWTSETIAAVILKCEQGGFTRHTVMHPKVENGIVNSVDPD